MEFVLFLKSESFIDPILTSAWEKEAVAAGHFIKCNWRSLPEFHHCIDLQGIKLGVIITIAEKMVKLWTMGKKQRTLLSEPGKWTIRYHTLAFGALKSHAAVIRKLKKII